MPDPQVKQTLVYRVKTVNHASHGSNWQETSLYRAFLGKVFHPRKGVIPIPTAEWLLCSLSFTADGLKKPINAKFWVVNGHFFMIQYSASIKKVRHLIPLVTKVEYNLPHPMAASQASEPPSAENLRRLLGPWAQNLEINNIKPPEGAEAKAERPKQLEIALPPDYLALMEKCGGFSTRDAEVFGVLDTRLVPGKEGFLCALPEFTDAHYLVVTQEKEIRLIDHEETEIVRFEGGFLDGLRQTLKNGL
jgi:hypothetical protein